MRFAPCFFAALSLLTPHVASAQNEGAAAALFDRGLAAMEAGKYESGCPALLESFRLDPRAGVLFTTAECENKWGKVATAMVHYNDYLARVERMSPADRVNQEARVVVAQKQKAALRAFIPRLTVVVHGTSEGVVVKRNGTALGGPSLGIALPVDPGEQILEVSNAEGAVVEKRVTIAKGQSLRVELEAPVAGSPSQGNVGRASSGTSSSRMPIVIGLGAAGGVGLLVGSVTGVMALSNAATVDENCTGSVCRNQTGKDAADAARSLATVSTLGFGAGIVLGGAALLVYLTAPAAQKSLAPSADGFRIRW